jgi:hypothetical protein
MLWFASNRFGGWVGGAASRLLLGTIFVLFLIIGSTARCATQGFILEVMLANEKGGTAQLYYDIGQWYTGVDSCRIPIPAGKELQAYRFPIPPEPIKHLRFDPADGAATLRIGGMRVLTVEGSEIARIDVHNLVPMHSITSLTIKGEVAEVITGQDEPMLSIDRPVQRETELALGRHFVSASEIWILFTIMIVLFGAVTVLAMVSGTAPACYLSAWGIFLIVFGARLTWLLHYSRPMPYWDEWETDALDLLIPFRAGYLDWQALFIPQGEHRILFTRIVNLATTLWNGEWDPRVEMTVSAGLLALNIALIYAVNYIAGRWSRILLGLGLISWSCFPFDIENIYWGDQTQMYVLNVLAVVVIMISLAERINGWVMSGALAAGLYSLFTMGSGMVAPFVAMLICMGRWGAERRARSGLVKLSLGFGLVALGGALLYRKAPYQGAGYAKTLLEWWAAFVARAAWPMSPQYLGLLVNLLPWIALTVVIVGSKKGSRLDWFAWGIGAWGVANACALAQGRPFDLPPFNPKYYTSMAMMVAGSTLAAVALSVRVRLIWAAPILAAAACSVFAMHTYVSRGIDGSPAKLAARSHDDNFVRPFLASGDPTTLRATSFAQLPYWNGAELAEYLDSPLLEPMLPAVLRTAAAQRENGVIRGVQLPGPLTNWVRGLMKAGLALVVLGGAIFLWAELKAGRRP